ncbi:MAG: caspase family protein [Candidatus Magnetoovum sp. WYHC-5]|nr:caspase family protein [Candidatus Magnetoovum sp. WYHC-5]
MARQALLVGVNDYQSASIGDLRGCINDVSNMRNILKTYFDFTNNDIRVLVDSRATKANIISRLEKMVATAKKGDCLLFHFSGHGSQIRDRNGDELKDYMDELICPYDMNWDNGFITDDTFDSIFKKLPEGVVMEVFLDSCHSGTGLRDLNLGRPTELGLENATLYRYLPPPFDIECRCDDNETLLKTRKFTSKERGAVQNILWAGCKADQTSADAYINGAYNGAFTYYLCKHMRDTKGKASRKELLKLVSASLKYGRYSQTPQLECEPDVQNAILLEQCLKPKG